MVMSPTGPSGEGPHPIASSASQPQDDGSAASRCSNEEQLVETSRYGRSPAEAVPSAEAHSAPARGFLDPSSARLPRKHDWYLLVCSTNTREVHLREVDAVPFHEPSVQRR